MQREQGPEITARGIFSQALPPEQTSGDSKLRCRATRQNNFQIVFKLIPKPQLKSYSQSQNSVWPLNMQSFKAHSHHGTWELPPLASVSKSKCTKHHHVVPPTACPPACTAATGDSVLFLIRSGTGTLSCHVVPFPAFSSWQILPPSTLRFPCTQNSSQQSL